MNDKYSAFSTHNANQNEDSFHLALAWLAALSAPIAAWAGIS